MFLSPPKTALRCAAIARGLLVRSPPSKLVVGIGGGGGGERRHASPSNQFECVVVESGSYDVFSLILLSCCIEVVLPMAPTTTTTVLSDPTTQCLCCAHYILPLHIANACVCVSRHVWMMPSVCVCLFATKAVTTQVERSVRTRRRHSSVYNCVCATAPSALL